MCVCASVSVRMYTPQAPGPGAAGGSLIVLRCVYTYVKRYCCSTRPARETLSSGWAAVAYTLFTASFFRPLMLQHNTTCDLVS